MKYQCARIGRCRIFFQGPEGQAIDLEIVRDFDSAEIEQRGQQVDMSGKGFVFGAGFEYAGIPDQEGNTHSSFINRAFKSPEARPEPVLLGPVIGHEDKYRVVEELFFTEHGQQPAYVFVDVAHHGVNPARIFQVLATQCGEKGGVESGRYLRKVQVAVQRQVLFRHLQRGVGRIVRKVEEKWLFCLVLHEFYRGIGKHVGAIAIGLDQAIPAEQHRVEIGAVEAVVVGYVAHLADAAGAVNEHLFKALVLRPEGVIVAQVPFAEDARAVSGLFQQLGHGALFRGHDGPAVVGVAHAGAQRMAAGEQAGSGWCADG